jgi:hypothetical protein
MTKGNTINKLYRNAEELQKPEIAQINGIYMSQIILNCEHFYESVD